MKATGIVRRIDELGRIVIPKEIRRTLHIRQSDPLEIFTDSDGVIVLKKYSSMLELADVSGEYVRALNGTFGHTAFVSDRVRILTASGHLKKQLVEHTLSAPAILLLPKRTVLEERSDSVTPLTVDQTEAFSAQTIVPIVSEGETIGLIGLVSAEPKAVMGQPELYALKTASLYLAMQLMP